MPMDRKRYPKNWEAIARSIKEKAQWQCENCGRPCHRPGEDIMDFLDRVAPMTANQTRDNFWGIEDSSGELKFGRFVLTVAHPNHDPENPDADLRAWCSVCHLRHDTKQMSVKRRLKRERLGQLRLFS